MIDILTIVFHIFFFHIYQIQYVKAEKLNNDAKPLDVLIPNVSLPCKKFTCRFGICENVIFNNKLDYTCHCVKGIGGRNCDGLDQHKFPCSSNPCHALAKCYNYRNDYYCDCPMARTGKDCSAVTRTSFDYCYSNPCGLNGICYSATNGHWCFCNDGSQGFSCSVSYEPPNLCTPDTCLNKGKCVSVVNSIICICNADFFGPKCEHSRTNSNYISECNSNLCHNNGVCTLHEKNVSCTCNSYYTGKFCETPVYTQCGFGLCNVFNGQCINSQCVCFQGYYGEKCQYVAQN